MWACECQVPSLNLGQLKSAMIDSELPERSAEALLGMLCSSVSSLVLLPSIPSQLCSLRNFLQASFQLRFAPWRIQPETVGARTSRKEMVLWDFEARSPAAWLAMRTPTLAVDAAWAQDSIPIIKFSLMMHWDVVPVEGSTLG